MCVVTAQLGNSEDTLIENHYTGCLFVKEQSDILENVQSAVRLQVRYQFHLSVSSTETGQARTCLDQQQGVTAALVEKNTPSKNSKAIC